MKQNEYSCSESQIFSSWERCCTYYIVLPHVSNWHSKGRGTEVIFCLELSRRSLICDGSLQVYKQLPKLLTRHRLNWIWQWETTWCNKFRYLCCGCHLFYKWLCPWDLCLNLMGNSCGCASKDYRLLYIWPLGGGLVAETTHQWLLGSFYHQRVKTGVCAGVQ